MINGIINYTKNNNQVDNKDINYIKEIIHLVKQSINDGIEFQNNFYNKIINYLKNKNPELSAEMINYGYIEQEHNKFFEKKKKESKKVKFSSKTGLKKIKNKFSEDNRNERKFTKPKNKKNNKLKKIDSIKITQKTTLTKENEKYLAKYSFNSTTKIKKIMKMKMKKN